MPNESNCQPFQVTPRPLGPPGLSYDNVEELLEGTRADPSMNFLAAAQARWTDPRA